MRLGVNWLAQAGAVLKDAGAVIFIMTREALRDGKMCKVGCVIAQEWGVPVIPVRMDQKVTEYPIFVTPGVRSTDCARDFNAGVHDLVQELARIACDGRAQHQDYPCMPASDFWGQARAATRR